MKQTVQNYKTGALQLTDVPTPARARQGQVLVRTMASLVSVGTEKSMLEMARKSLLGRAMARLDPVRQVIAKAQAEGNMGGWAWGRGSCRANFIWGVVS
jgi:hypothetical protein